jgi:ubiquitin-conjugating enzyme E2 variant
MMTNQFHKWSHLDPKDMPLGLATLQRWRLVLNSDHHSVHHTAPFTTYYCITHGWLNWPLHKLGFFRGMEKVVTALTGAIPRQDDIGLEAALATAPMKPLEPSPEPQVDLSRP